MNTIEPIAWLAVNSDGDHFYYDKQDALDACDGFIQPLFAEVQMAYLQRTCDRHVEALRRIASGAYPEEFRCAEFAALHLRGTVVK
jgi:hypothetical protein